ncbi:C2H2-type zinc finger protein [Embleya sp. NPDC001921]
MNPNMIRVRPQPLNRIAFAQWAVVQVPKVRTVTPYEFAVPAEQFAAMPEALLIGSTVDGHPYVSPQEDAATGTPPPGAEPAELLGVATAAGFAEVQGAMTGAIVAADVAAANAADRQAEAESTLPEPDDSDPSDPSPEAPEGVFPCTVCEREFTSDRGLSTHLRRAHAEADEVN